ncbi:MAG: type II toxin-antitoxin system HicB family antitoxin [Syntrophobacteraceae bacterium]
MKTHEVSSLCLLPLPQSSALKGCHSQARPLDELVTRIKEAIELCREVQEEDLEPLDFVGVQQVSVTA